jgi:galactoside O-acetyltransferase
MASNPSDFMTPAELASLGLKSCGSSVLLSRRAALFNPQYITLGSHVRIDGNVLISAGALGVEIDHHVHIAYGACLFGSHGIRIAAFCGISAYGVLLSASDDYSEGHLTNPTVPGRLRKVTAGVVQLDRHVLIGSHSVVFPGVHLGFGASVGALSLVNKSVPEGAIITGNPPRRIGTRSTDKLREMEKALEN